MATDLEGNLKKSRTRSPAYPYLDLRSALEKAAVLWKAEGRHSAALNVVMHHWGYKEESSTGYSCMAALKKFGLIDHDGTGENKQIRLSGLALAILLDENPDSAARVDALHTAALSPRIHAELWERYGSDLPSDQSLKRYLVLEKNFNETVVDELVAEYKQTINFAGLNLLPAPPAAAGPGGFASGVQAGGGLAPTTTPASVAPTAGRYAPPAALADDPPYEDRRELAPPPSRAIGPAKGTHRDVQAYEPAPRESGAGERPYAAGGRSGAESNGTDAHQRRRPLAAEGYAPVDGQRAAERERTRYDQEAFGYEEEYFAPVRRDFQQPPSASAPVPVLVPASVPASSAPASYGVAGVEVETSNGAPRKELPVPLDGDRVALVPYPMTEEDFTLLIATLQLWKKRLVRGRE